MLRGHIADVELEKLAEPPRERDDTGRVVGVDVDLHQLGLADHQNRVAHCLDLAPNPVDVELGPVDQELGAIAPTALGQIQHDLRRARHAGGRLDVERLGLLDRLEHALEDDLKAVASRVDHARIAEDLELARGLDDGRLRTRGCGGDHAGHAGISVAGSG